MQSGRTISGPKVETTTNWESQGEGTLAKLLVKIELDEIFKLFEGMVGKQIEK